MNDPSVAHLQMPLREVKAIRLMIYDEQKNMTPDEIRDYYDKLQQRVEKEYGIKFVASAKQLVTKYLHSKSGNQEKMVAAFTMLKILIITIRTTNPKFPK